MKYSLIIVTTFLFLACTPPRFLYEFSTQNYYNTPADLLDGAHSTIQESDIELIIHDRSKATYRERVAVTIHNEEHQKYADVYEFYDQLSSIEYMNARLIDRNGKIVETYSMKDAGDYSVNDGVSFFSDNRVKVLEFYHPTYPYTIEYEIEKTLYGTLNLPDWYPMQPDQSVVVSRFSITDYNTGVRTHPVELNSEVAVIEGGEYTTYRWDYNNQTAIETEPYSSVRDNLPHMLVAPGEFEIEGTVGDARTWETFGKWYYDLGAQTRALPDAAKAEIDALVKGVENEREIVAILFNYLQEKNRYVSIQLGIGGWKPFPAEFVFDNSYGDCKALTNYMLAALEYVGIDAHAVLINASADRPLIEDFPGNQFNHVVLRVTLENGEEIWLECTSKYLPPNNLGNGYSKKALLVSAEGGTVVETPDVTNQNNKKVSVYSINIDEQGHAKIEGELAYQGASQGRVLYQLLSVSEAKKTEWLEDMLPTDHKSIELADFSGVDSKKDITSIKYKAQLDHYARSSSKRLYVPLNKLNRTRIDFKDVETRNLPIRFRYAYSESDSVLLNFPEGYEIESRPLFTNTSTEFAAYTQKLERITGNTYLYIRTMELKEREIAPELYDDLRNFYQDLRKDDYQQLVLVRKDS
ncbi:MAG: DUF3857 domain-containing transglutaminase family protein [Balneolaceae bacterium]|nr:DUF3857 domain-containing transglutaminase family protein [Balneolaceae bacterium]